jgi:hypothetical protein
MLSIKIQRGSKNQMPEILDSSENQNFSFFIGKSHMISQTIWILVQLSVAFWTSFEYRTIRQPDSYGTFKYWSSLVFRSPLYECIEHIKPMSNNQKVNTFNYLSWNPNIVDLLIKTLTPKLQTRVTRIGFMKRMSSSTIGMLLTWKLSQTSLLW